MNYKELSKIVDSIQDGDPKVSNKRSHRPRMKTVKRLLQNKFPELEWTLWVWDNYSHYEWLNGEGNNISEEEVSRAKEILSKAYPDYYSEFKIELYHKEDKDVLSVDREG